MEGVQAFVADYEVAFGETLDYFASSGYEAAIQVMDRLSGPGVTSRVRLIQALKAAGFDQSTNFKIFEEGG